MRTTDSTDVAEEAPPYRLRELDRRGRLWALAFALALTLAPVHAYLSVIDDWLPASDPALMAIQTLNVGTEHTPLTGQPSTSAEYVDADRHVDHLGPLHFYLMAGPVRAFGLHHGMLGTSLAIVAGSALLSAWAAFRRLGPTGGVVAAVLIGLTMFTTGASSLMLPVSSNIAGYPLFCAAVLLWCVLRGDLKLLPLAAAVTTFAAQIHLSIIPSVAVLVPAALAGLLWHWGRDGRWRDTDARRNLALWTGAAALVSLLLWSPMLVQEATNNPGNLTALVELTGDDDRPTLGPTSAVRQVTHVLGLPPELGGTDLHLTAAGAVLLESPSIGTTVSALAVVGLLGLLAWHWRRRHQPERQSLVTMAAVLAVAGLVNGSSVLDSIEAVRIVLYHWIWPLTFFVTLALLLGAAELVHHLVVGQPTARNRVIRVIGQARRHLPSGASAAARPALLSAALLAVVVPAAVGARLDRPTNDLRAFYTPVERRYVEELTDQVLDHRDRLDQPFLVTQRGSRSYTSLRSSLTLYLVDAGLDARLPRHLRFYVADDRIAWPAQVDGNGGLLLVHDFDTDWREVEHGELIADVLTIDEDLADAFTDLREMVGSGRFEFGPDVRAGLDRLPDEWIDLAEQGRLDEVEDDITEQLLSMDVEELRQTRVIGALDAAQENPEELLTSPEALAFLVDHPLVQPRLDLDRLPRLDSTELSRLRRRPFRMRVYLLDQEELDRF